MNAHTRNSTEQIHRFEDGDETIVVKVMKLTDGTYAAVELENFDDRSPIGNGFSSLEAIADLFSRLPRARSDREERDAMADKWDHDRKLRAESV